MNKSPDHQLSHDCQSVPHRNADGHDGSHHIASNLDRSGHTELRLLESSIATELNPSSGGLLTDLGTISAVKLWLEPFKFVGMAMLLSGIGLALATIVRVLRWQSSRFWEILS